MDESRKRKQRSVEFDGPDLRRKIERQYGDIHRVAGLVGTCSKTIQRACDGIGIERRIAAAITALLEGNPDLLATFARRLSEDEQARVVCYHEWHPAQLDEKSKDEFFSVTHDELGLLWGNHAAFPPYEQYLLALRRRKISVKRIFLWNDEFRCPECSEILTRTLLRHAEFGFETRAMKVSEFRRIVASQSTDVRFETVAVAGDQTLYMRFPKHGPEMIASRRADERTAALRLLNAAWDDAKHADTLLERACKSCDQVQAADYARLDIRKAEKLAASSRR